MNDKKPCLLQKIGKCSKCGNMIEVSYFEGDKGYAVVCIKCGDKTDVQDWGHIVGHWDLTRLGDYTG